MVRRSPTFNLNVFKERKRFHNLFMILQRISGSFTKFETLTIYILTIQS